MDYFFHADTTKYRRRLRGTAIIVLVPLFGVCVFCAVNILLNLGAGNSSGIHGAGDRNMRAGWNDNDVRCGSAG